MGKEIWRDLGQGAAGKTQAAQPQAGLSPSLCVSLVGGRICLPAPPARFLPNPCLINHRGLTTFSTRRDPAPGCRPFPTIAGCPWVSMISLCPASCPHQPCKCFPAATGTSHHFLCTSGLGNEPLTKAVMSEQCGVSCQRFSVQGTRLWDLCPLIHRSI